MSKKQFILPQQIKINDTRLELDTVDYNYDADISVSYVALFSSRPSRIDLTFKTEAEYHERLKMIGAEVSE